MVIGTLVGCGDPKIKNYELYVTEQLPMAKVPLIKARKAYKEFKKSNGTKQKHLLDTAVLPQYRKFIKALEKIDNPSSEVDDLNQQAIDETKNIINALQAWHKVLDKPSTDSILRARSKAERQQKKLKAWENELADLAYERKITIPKDWIPGSR